MASTERQRDPLLLMRRAIAEEVPIQPTTSEDASAPIPTPPPSLATATHLRFGLPGGAAVALPLDAPTRFVLGSDKPVNLRSIYFAWLNRNTAIPDYNAAAARLNDELSASGSGGATIQNLTFVERVNLFTWLEGGSEESEYIRPLAGEKAGLGAAGASAAGAGSAAASAAAGATVTLKGQAVPAAVAAARSGKGTLDPRLAVIYSGERKMGDRNTVLRGIKPTDFSHVRKLALPLIANKKAPLGSAMNNPSLALNPKTPASTRRPDPIILLSPSASSLLRLSNIKSFLEGGRYTPPEYMAGGTSGGAAGAGTGGISSTASMLHLSRAMREIDPTRPTRFILVEGTEQFKPEYWNRVVAVFTTGQAWQFKSYRWQRPEELFRHVLGVYVGWRGDQVPDAIRHWGPNVLKFEVDKWRDSAAAAAEAGYRDQLTVEGIWRAIERSMQQKGWRKDAGPTSI